MMINRQAKMLVVQLALALIIVIHSSPGSAQAPDRTPYADLPDWTVTTYRAAETKAFQRCSAERHYEDGLTLTIAKNAAGKYVLGFTSSAWPYEDRSTHSISIKIDSGEELSMPGRVRLLPVGPIVFLDLDDNSSVISSLSAGANLHVRSDLTVLKFDLTGSAAAVSNLESCHRDGAGDESADS